MRSLIICLSLVCLLEPAVSSCSPKDFKAAREDENGCFTGTAKGVSCHCQKDDANCCEGKRACDWPQGSKVMVCPKSCNGKKACQLAHASKLEVGPGSCNGELACRDIGQGEALKGGISCSTGGCDAVVGFNSCNGGVACSRAQGQVGNDSCNGEAVCYSTQASVGHQACTDDRSCMLLAKEGGIGDRVRNRRRLSNESELPAQDEMIPHRDLGAHCHHHHHGKKPENRHLSEELPASEGMAKRRNLMPQPQCPGHRSKPENRILS